MIFILAKMRAGFSFRKCYMFQHPRYDKTMEEFIKNRVKISWYLRKLYLGVYLEIGQNYVKTD